MTDQMNFTAPKFDGDGPVAPLAANVRFGAATAAFQVEGATRADGRGESIWDRFCRTPGAVANGDTGDVACEHYRRWEADLDLMAALGLEAYRFSIAWPRVQPLGRGAVNDAGLRFYRMLAEGLRERGIEPIATLYHWDLPQALQDEGGWAARDTAARFAEYAAICGEALGDVVTQWITHNEPWVVAFLGHAAGVKAPGVRDWPTALRVSHHLLLSHGLAAQALRAVAPSDVEVGIALNLAPVHAAGPGEDHRAAALRMDGHLNRWFLDPVLRGRYPEDMLDLYERRYGAPLHEQRNGDLPVIHAPIDFLGVNYYFPNRVTAPGAGNPLGFETVPIEGAELTSFGWPVVPSAFTELLLTLRERYPDLPPIFITENGAAFADEPEGGEVHDDRRVAYLDSHLTALVAAIEAGADVRGYFCWSLLDNFEWAEGYRPKFGLYSVDRSSPAYTRTATEGATVLGDIASTHTLTAEQRNTYGGDGPMTPDPQFTDEFCTKVTD
jgi:beta-glucosidase